MTTATATATTTADDDDDDDDDDGGGGGGGGGGVGGGGGKGTHALPHVKVPQGRGLPKGPTHSDNGTMNESVIFVQELSPEAKKVRCRWVALQVSLTSSAPHWGSSGKRCGGEKHRMRGRWYVLQSELHRTAQTVMASMAAIAHGGSAHGGSVTEAAHGGSAP